jgi:hypothetical protein
LLRINRLNDIGLLEIGINCFLIASSEYLKRLDILCKGLHSHLATKSTIGVAQKAYDNLYLRNLRSCHFTNQINIGKYNITKDVKIMIVIW